MSREIKFRGKRVNNGEWVYGYLRFIYIDTDRASIYDPISVSNYDVLLETVGQYTGVKDKNGKEIYEGDILKDEFNRIFIVYWVEKEARFSMRQKNRKTEYFMFINHLSEEVIGNIYDNPELWEKGDNQC